MARAKKPGIRPQQFRRQNAAEHSVRRTVQIRKQAIQQPRALDQSFANVVPMRPGDEQGNKIQAPGPVQSIRVAVNVVRDAVLMNQSPCQISPVAELSGFQLIEQGNEFAPVRAEGAVRLNHFIGKW